MAQSWPRVATAVALAALVAWSAWTRWQVLAASPFPLGIDGYFYPVELRALLEHGALQYPTSPLTLWWMLPFAAATDPIIGAKLGAALGGALIAVPAYGVGARLGRGRGPGLVAAAICAASASSLYLSFEFVKQSIGLTVGLAALWLALRAIERPSRGRLAAAVAGALAVGLTHKLAAALVIAIAVPAALVEARRRGKRVGPAIAAAVVLAVGALVALGDAGLVTGLLAARAQWSAPALATAGTTLGFDHEALIGGAVAVIAALVLVRRRGEPGDDVARWCVVAIAAAIALPWLDVADPQGLAFRLRIAAFVPLALCAAIAVGALRRELVGAVLAVAVVGYASQRDATEGVVLAHPALVASSLAVADYAPPGATLIVPERHIAFMLAWYARVPVSLRPEPVPRAERVRVLPLAFFGQHSPLDVALDAARREPGLAPPVGVHPRYRNGFVLVEESTWDWLLARLPSEQRAHFAAWPTI